MIIELVNISTGALNLIYTIIIKFVFCIFKFLTTCFSLIKILLEQAILLATFVAVWAEEERESKSLRSVFPFRQIQQHRNNRTHITITHGNHGPHTDSFSVNQQPLDGEYYTQKVDPVIALPGRESRQGGDRDGFGEDNTHSNHGHHTDSFNINQQPIDSEYYTKKVDPVIFLPARESRQGGDRDGFRDDDTIGNDFTIDLGSVAAAGERCIDKVVMVEETRYDDVIECKHSYTEKCHTTYITDFRPQQEEECEENFVKNCFIEYKNIASEETVQFCHTPLECAGEGPEECKTVYESECQTSYHEHDVEDDVVNCYTIQEEKCEDITQGYSTEEKCTKWPIQKCDNVVKKSVKKYSPETYCRKVPRELCGPSGCELSPGPEFCFDKKETVIQEVITYLDYDYSFHTNYSLTIDICFMQ